MSASDSNSSRKDPSKSSSRKSAKKRNAKKQSGSAQASDKHPDTLEQDPEIMRVTRHVQPVGPRILVRISKSPDRLESGLYVPAGSRDDAAQALLGEVVEVARTTPKDVDYSKDENDEDFGGGADLGRNVSGIPVGSEVLFSKEKGIAVPWDESLRLLDVRNVLAIVDQIREDQMQ